MALFLQYIIKLILDKRIFLNLHQYILNIFQFLLTYVPSRFCFILLIDLESFTKCFNLLICFIGTNQLLEFSTRIRLTDTNYCKLELCWLIFRFTWIRFFFFEIWVKTCTNPSSKRVVGAHRQNPCWVEKFTSWFLWP